MSIPKIKLPEWGSLRNAIVEPFLVPLKTLFREPCLVNEMCEGAEPLNCKITVKSLYKKAISNEVLWRSNSIVKPCDEEIWFFGFSWFCMKQFP